MAILPFLGTSGNGINSEDVTSLAKNILEGTKTVTVDSNDEVLTGTLVDRNNITQNINCGATVSLNEGKYDNSTITVNNLASQTSASAAANKVLNGYKGWKDGSQVTGNVAIKNATNFSASAISTNTIRISWKNPSSGPWEGVFIQMSTSGTPGSSGGSRVYTGKGANATAGANNYCDIGGLAEGTTYYFTCTTYVNNVGWGSSANLSAKTPYNSFDVIANTAASTWSGSYYVWDQRDDGGYDSTHGSVGIASVDQTNKIVTTQANFSAGQYHSESPSMDIGNSTLFDVTAYKYVYFEVTLVTGTAYSYNCQLRVKPDGESKSYMSSGGNVSSDKLGVKYSYLIDTASVTHTSSKIYINITMSNAFKNAQFKISNVLLTNEPKSANFTDATTKLDNWAM